MIALTSGLRVYLACGITDMRKGMTGLAMLVQQGLSADPFDGALFAFRKGGCRVIVVAEDRADVASRRARGSCRGRSPRSHVPDV